jgi:hypothetical protein
VPCGRKESASEPSERQPGEPFGGEPGDVAELAVADGRGAIDDRRFIHRRDVRDPVSVRVPDLIIRAAEHVNQPHQADPGADLLASLSERCLRRRLAHLDRAAEDSPPVVMTSVADEQQPPCPVDGED